MKKVNFSSTSYKTIRLVVSMYVAMIVSSAVVSQNFVLALAGVISGMIVLWLARKRTKVITADEMILTISGKAARITYSLTTVSLALVSLVLMFLATEPFPKALGIIFSYLALAMMVIYSIVFKYLMHQQS